MRRRGGLSLERRRRRCNEKTVGNRRLGDGSRSTRRDRSLSASICAICGSIPCPFWGGRGRQSGSVVVHLEVFTNWARHASPLHRYAPYWTGIVCVGVSERRSRSPLRIIGVNLRNLRFDSLPLWGGRGRQSGSVVVHLEVFTKWARHASPLHRYAPYWTGIVCVGVPWAPFPFAPVHSRRQSAKSAVRFPVSGAVAVDNRGRWSFTWRSLRSGRGTPRPYTDMPLTGPVLCAWAFQGAVPVRPCA